MPANIVKPGDEATWDKAKARVKEEYDLDEGSDRFYKLAVSIYQRMAGLEKSRPLPRLVLLRRHGA